MPHSVLIATTVAPWKANGNGELAWLERAEERWVKAREAGIDVSHFIAYEVDDRGMAPYSELEARLGEDLPMIHTVTHQFMMNTGETEYSGRSRLGRICAGRTMAHDYAQQQAYTHILFLDSDVEVEDDCVPKLLEVDHGIVGGHVPVYGLDGPQVEEHRNIDLREHWNTAGFLLVRRDVFRALRWRWDLETGCTDDPCFQQDAVKGGWGQTWVRHDVIGVHVEPMVPVEDRNDVDRKIYQETTP